MKLFPENLWSVGKKLLSKNENAWKYSCNVISGITCLSCRAFFRRAHQAANTAGSNGPDFKCKKEGQCSVTIWNRRRCQVCKLYGNFSKVIFKTSNQRERESYKKSQISSKPVIIQPAILQSLIHILCRNQSVLTLPGERAHQDNSNKCCGL